MNSSRTIVSFRILLGASKLTIGKLKNVKLVKHDMFVKILYKITIHEFSDPAIL